VKHDPTRQALATAIKAASTAHAAATQAREALSRAEAFLQQAKGRHVEAEEALNKALAEQGESLASAIASGTAPSVGGAVRAARTRLIDAEDEVAGAKAAVAKLKDAVQGPEDDAAAAKLTVEQAVAGVVGGEVEILLEAARQAQLEYIERCAVLNEVRRLLHPWTADHKAISSFVDAGTLAIHQRIGWASVPAVEDWRRAVAALSRDATVRLPVPRPGQLPQEAA
jgi:hypothetical protein